ncbi:MAG: cellulase family glycosylhydrolase, partial [Cytophagales bacterium]|nr:cellulase family glycosylhydrolase [Rhizobacter sp.]
MTHLIHKITAQRSEPTRLDTHRLTTLMMSLCLAGLSACGGADAPRTDTQAAAPAGDERARALAVGDPASSAYYVQDGKLYDPCGVQVVLRGVNKMVVYADRAGNSFPEIAKTGANAVRFMWYSQVAASEAVQTIQRAIDSQLIPIWELHDATGNWSAMPTIENYWTNPATLTVLRQFDSKLIVNLANEAGQGVDDNDMVATYSRIISRLRTAGLRMPFMIDAAGYGRNEAQLLRVAPRILAADPLHNVIFSWHVYDPGSESRITAAFDTANAQRIPFLVGEFGSNVPGACQATVPYRHLITQAQAKGIGYLAWSWDNFNGDCKIGDTSVFDMVGDGINLSTLKPGFATEVVRTDPASIQNTSRRTQWQTAGTCAAAPAPAPSPAPT